MPKLALDEPIAPWHEAGHAVVARLLGALEISVVTEAEDDVDVGDDKDEDKLAETQVNDPDWLTSISVDDHLAYCAGGQAAEHIVSEGAAWSIRCALAPDEPADVDRAVKALGKMPEDLAAWWRALVLKTTVLLRPRWHEVEALAGLLRRGEWVMLYAGDDGPKWRTAGGAVDAYESQEERAQRLAGTELARRPGGIIRISV